MEYKLSDSELTVMNVLWKNGDMPAIEIALALKKTVSWEKSTVYTLISRLIKKGAIEKKEPGYICKATARQNEIREAETNSLLEKLYGGSLNLLVKSFVKDKKLSKSEIEELKKLLDEMEG